MVLFVKADECVGAVPTLETRYMLTLHLIILYMRLLTPHIIVHCTLKGVDLQSVCQQSQCVDMFGVLYIVK